MTIVNLTPHPITLRDGEGVDHTIAPSGQVARVSSTPGTLAVVPGVPVPVATPTVFGEVTGLPNAVDGTVFIVSAIVGSALVGKGRSDVFLPGTGPNDGAIRNEKGHIVAVTRLVAIA